MPWIWIVSIIAIVEFSVIVYLLDRKVQTYSGEIQVIHTPEGQTYSLELNGDPAELETMDEVKFKVVPIGINRRGGNIS